MLRLQYTLYLPRASTKNRHLSGVQLPAVKSRAFEQSYQFVEDR
jgi:hypothetical protein